MLLVSGHSVSLYPDIIPLSNCFVVFTGKELVTFRTRDLERALLVVTW